MNKDINSILAESFERNREKVAVIQHENGGKTRSVSFETLSCLAAQLRTSFTECAEHGRAVGIFMRRSTEHVAAIVAALRSGTPYFSINPMVSVLQVSEMLQVANTGVLLCDNSTLLKLSRMSREQIADTQIIHLHDGPLNPAFQTAFDKISQVANIETHSLQSDFAGAITKDASACPDIGRLLLFTSGSTGSPKGVRIGDADLTKRVAAEANAYGISATDTLLGMLPFSFDVGCNQMYTALTRGSTLVLLNSWLPADILNAIETYGVTGVSGVPTLWDSVLGADEARLRAAFAKLRYITISGGDMTDEGLARLRQLGPNLAIFKTYGQTETFRSAMLMPEEFDQYRRSVGRPPTGARVLIVTPDGRKAKDGEVGEIVHEGSGTMLGYAGDQTATDRKLRSHPFPTGDADQLVIFTGDRGKQDQDGYLYVLGRMDRMIKIRGNRVYPEEVESQLLTHPGISEAVVVLLKNAGKEELVAGVRLNETDLKPRDISIYLAQRLPTYMIPDRTSFVESLPRTATGKIDFAAASKLLNTKPADLERAQV